MDGSNLIKAYPMLVCIDRSYASSRPAEMHRGERQVWNEQIKAISRHAQLDRGVHVWQRSWLF